MIGPAKVPPFGEGTATVGWSRSSVAVALPTSHRRALSMTWARVPLVGLRSVAFVSRPVSSKAKYARRAGVPPQAPAPEVPFAAEETQRSPTGWFLVHPLPWTVLLSVQTRYEVPPATAPPFGKRIWSSAAPGR